MEGILGISRFIPSSRLMMKDNVVVVERVGDGLHQPESTMVEKTRSSGSLSDSETGAG